MSSTRFSSRWSRAGRRKARHAQPRGAVPWTTRWDAVQHRQLPNPLGTESHVTATDAKGTGALFREEAGAGAACSAGQELRKACSHLPGLRGATRCRNVGTSGGPLRVPPLPPPAAGARFHCGGSLSLQTLGGSCEQRQTELRGWARKSFSISPAAPGAPVKGTADTCCDPTLSCGGFLPRPVPSIPSTPRSWGCSAEHSDGTRGAQSTATHSCLARGQAPQGTWFWLQPCPFQPGRAAGKGLMLPILEALLCCTQSCTAREVEETTQGAQPSVLLHRANGVGGVLHPPGQGSAGMGPSKQQAWSCCRAVPTELRYVTQPARQLAL